ncbi:Inositol-phosphate phosphatase [Gracilaria domingensis]|nr:Inositol-phosphate phosphatase [Gracilaria domingensis]
MNPLQFVPSQHLASHAPSASFLPNAPCVCSRQSFLPPTAFGQPSLSPSQSCSPLPNRRANPLRKEYLRPSSSADPHRQVVRAVANDHVPHRVAFASSKLPSHIIDTAVRAADIAGVIIRKYFRKPIEISFKHDESPVTKADKEVESAIRALINEAFPEHTIIGEEHGTLETQLQSEYQWIIDPIDGTKAFMTGRPTFATLIAVARRGVPLLGIIDQPISQERWVGIADEQTTLNGKPVTVRDPPMLSKCVLQATTPDMFVGWDGVLFRKLSTHVKAVVYGSDCYAYAMLASGFSDLVVEADLKVWDFMALVPVITGAGGFMGDWCGMTLSLQSEGRVIAASGEKLFGDVSQILNPLDEMGLYPGRTKATYVPELVPEDPGDGSVESMTGFGYGTAEGSGYIVNVQARSVNSKYCDVQINCPRYLSLKDSELINMVKSQLRRGQIMLNIDVNDEESPDDVVPVNVDRKAAAEVRQLLDKLAEAAGITKEPSLSDVIRFSEVFNRSNQVATAEHVLPVARAAVINAVRDLRVSRRREGVFLQYDILQRTRKIKKTADEISLRLPRRVEAKRKHLRDLTEGLTVGIDSNRLEAEIMTYADRTDVTEELTRLLAHVHIFELSFLPADEPVGQRLNFLLQEMRREITTLSNKCEDSAVNHLSVTIKEEIEKIREQCVNIR